MSDTSVTPEQPASCSPAETLDSETLVQVLLETYARFSMWPDQVSQAVHNRWVECKAEVLKRLARADLAAVVPLTQPDLHLAVCNAVQLLNSCVHTEPEQFQARDILRQALVDYADAPPSEVAPINMLLFCPVCWEQHIDEPEEICGELVSNVIPGCICTGGKKHSGSHGASDIRWLNPPHKSHLCHKCGAVWRPADVPTNGVAKISTAGSRDSWAPCAASPSAGFREGVKAAIRLVKDIAAEGATYNDDEILTSVILIELERTASLHPRRKCECGLFESNPIHAAKYEHGKSHVFVAADSNTEQLAAEIFQQMTCNNPWHQEASPTSACPDCALTALPTQPDEEHPPTSPEEEAATIVTEALRAEYVRGARDAAAQCCAKANGLVPPDEALGADEVAREIVEGYCESVMGSDSVIVRDVRGLSSKVSTAIREAEQRVRRDAQRIVEGQLRVQGDDDPEGYSRGWNNAIKFTLSRLARLGGPEKTDAYCAELGNNEYGGPEREK